MKTLAEPVAHFNSSFSAEDKLVVPDFMTLKYAIYFIVPAVGLYVAAFVFGGVFVLVAQFFVQRDISHDEAGRMMAVVIAAAAGAAAFVQWTTESLWASVAAGSAASYVAGALLFSWTIKDFASGDQIYAPACMKEPSDRQTGWPSFRENDCCKSSPLDCSSHLTQNRHARYPLWTASLQLPPRNASHNKYIF